MKSIIAKLALASFLAAHAISCSPVENSESRKANSPTQPAATVTPPAMAGSGTSSASEKSGSSQHISGEDAATAKFDLMSATRELLGEMFRGEAKAVGGLLADDYKNTRPDGTVEDKAQYLANLKSFAGYNGFIIDEFKVESLKGDTATVSGLVQVSNEEKKSFYSRFTWTFVKRQGKWLLQSSQNTEMKDSY